MSYVLPDGRPTPGSSRADLMGCICPQLDNEFGAGIGGNGLRFGYVVREHCPIHTFADASPIRRSAAINV